MSLMGNGQNDTLAAFTKYLNGYGFDFALAIFPMKKGATDSASARRGKRPWLNPDVRRPPRRLSLPSR